MQKIIASFIIVLSVLVAACGAKSEPQPAEQPVVSDVAVVAAETAKLDESKLNVVEKSLRDQRQRRQASVSWGAQVRLGDVRSYDNIADDLYDLDRWQREINVPPFSVRKGLLLRDIRQAMIDDCKQLLDRGRRDRSLWALERFLKYAPELDTDLEKDFGITPEELRAEALVIAKGDVAELLPRLREDAVDGDAAGGVIGLIREWGFTPQELGLTEKDAAKIVVH